MACCGKSVGAVNAPTDQSDWVLMAYTGSNSGAITFSGYLKRRYRVVRGSQILVHPEDASRLDATKKFVTVPQEKPAPEPTPAPTVEAVATSATTTGINATDSAIELAEQNGIDLATVQGSGLDGRIVLRDIKALIDG